MGTRSKFRMRHETKAGALLLRCDKCNRLVSADKDGRLAEHKTVIRNRIAGWKRTEAETCA